MLVRCVLMLCLGIVIAGTAMADAIVTSSVPTFDGDLYHYTYTVTNPELRGGFSIWSFQLFFSGPYQDVVSPTNWTPLPAIPPANTIQWAVLDFGTGVILPEGSLSGFGFASPNGPGLASYQVVFDLGKEVNSLSGATEGPSVPEPATFVLGALGLMGVFALSRFRRG
jgi:hypothetical protein